MRKYLLRTYIRPVAQLVEWRSPKPQVGGSKPSWPANLCKVNMNSSSVENKTKLVSHLSWLALVVITALAFFCTYYFDMPTPIQAILWLTWLITTMLFFYCTEQGKTVFQFAKESKIEMQKVVWPSRTETGQTTMIVMAMVAVTGFVLWAVDVGMMWIIGKITHLG